MKVANEVRVGIVVVAALVLAVVGYFSLLGVGMGAQQYYLRLDGAAIVNGGNDVRLQGVKIGIVKEVSIDPDTQMPILVLSVRKGNPAFSLYRSYRYAVKSSGLVGENYVDIQGTPVSGDDAYLPNDRTQLIPTHASTGLLDMGSRTDEVIKDLRVTLGKFNTTLDRINNGVLSSGNQGRLAKALDGVTRLTDQVARSFGPGGMKVGFGDPNTQRYLNATLINASAAASEAGMVARDMRHLTSAAGGVLNASSGVIKENRQQLHQLISNLDRTTSNAADTIESINFLVKNSNLDSSVKNAGLSIERAAKNVEDTTASFKALSDEETQKEVRTAISALRESTQALRDATTGLKNVLGDEKVQNDIKAIPAELRSTLEATSATANRINSLLGGKRKKTSDEKNSEHAAEKKSSSHPSGIDFTYRHWSDGQSRRNNFGDLRFQAELFGSPFRVGFDNIGEGTDFTLQSGRYLGSSAAVRYGLYRSKLGVGADYHRGRFSLEGNLYDPNDRSWNAYAGFKVTPNAEILFGREKQGDVRTNAIGVRLRP